MLVYRQIYISILALLLKESNTLILFPLSTRPLFVDVAARYRPFEQGWAWVSHRDLGGDSTSDSWFVALPDCILSLFTSCQLAMLPSYSLPFHSTIEIIWLLHMPTLSHQREKEFTWSAKTLCYGSYASPIHLTRGQVAQKGSFPTHIRSTPRSLRTASELQNHSLCTQSHLSG